MWGENRSKVEEAIERNHAQRRIGLLTFSSFPNFSAVIKDALLTLLLV